MSSTGEGTERSTEPSGAERTAPAEGPVLIHVWEVLDPAHHDPAVGSLQQMLSQLADQTGFISGRVLESADQHSIAVVLEMGTVEDRHRLEQLPVVRDTLEHLDGMMSIIIRLYHQIGAYHA